MQEVTAPGDTARSHRPLQESLAALRLGLNSDLSNIHAFIVNAVERGREGVKPGGAVTRATSREDGSASPAAASEKKGSSPALESVSQKSDAPLVAFSSFEKIHVRVYIAGIVML